MYGRKIAYYLYPEINLYQPSLSNIKNFFEKQK